MTDKVKIDPATHFAKQRDMNCNETMALLQSEGTRFWSWGAHAFTNIKNKALRMKVEGHHHKGHVYISVNGMDLYDVHLTNLDGTLKEEITDIYFDDLFNTIDKKVEYISEYKD